MGSAKDVVVREPVLINLDERRFGKARQEAGCFVLLTNTVPDGTGARYAL
jgi:hypothetical protein